MDATSGENNLITLTNASSNHLLYIDAAIAGPNRWNFDHRDPSGSFNKLSFIPNTNPHILKFDRLSNGVGTIDTFNISRDGQSNLDNSTVWGEPKDMNNISGSKYFNIGSLAYNNMARAYDGQISEILIFDSNLSSKESAEIMYYLAQKWGLTTTVDSDNDGFTDAVEIAANTSATNATDFPLPDFSKTVGDIINADKPDGERDATDLGSIEDRLALWLDAANINAQDNTGLSDGDAISEWKDLSGNGNHFTNDSRHMTSGALLSDAQKIKFAAGNAIKFNGSPMSGTLIKNSLKTEVSGSSIESIGTNDFHAFLVVRPEKTSYQTLMTFGNLGNSRINTDDYRGSFHLKTHGPSNLSYFSEYSDYVPTNTFLGNGDWIQMTIGDTPPIQILRVSRTGNELTAYSNGREELNTLFTDVSGNEVPDLIDFGKMTQLRLGDLGHDRTGDHFAGEFYEVILIENFNGFNPAEISSYLAQKWGLESTVDSDNDGFTDAVEIAANTSPTNATDLPLPDFSGTVGTVINADGSDATDLASVEGSLALWLDASNDSSVIRDASNNVSHWLDLSGNKHHAVETEGTTVSGTLFGCTNL